MRKSKNWWGEWESVPVTPSSPRLPNNKHQEIIRRWGHLSRPVTKDDVQQFIDRLEASCTKRSWEQNIKLKIKVNKRFIKVSNKADGDNYDTANCFVEIETGYVWRPGAYSVPCKDGIRGHVLDPNPSLWMDWSGPKDLK